MGCWNGTCAISNLPITCTDDVIGIVVVSSSLGDPYSYHTPLPFYIEGEYDDYGGIDNEHGPMIDFMINLLQDKCLAIPEGENEYHEFEIKPSEFNWDSISAAYLKNRLRAEVSVYGQTPEIANINILHIRKDVFDMIIENHVINIRKDGDDWNNTVSFADILDDYGYFYREVKDQAKDGGTSALARLLSRFNSVYESRDNYIGILLQRLTEMSPANDLCTAQETITEMAENGSTSDELYPVVENALAVRVLDLFIRDTHRQWIVPGYAGQEGDTDAHCLLASTIIEISEKLHQDMDE